MYYVYILALANGEYYVGYTTDIQDRIRKHKAGTVTTTQRIKPKRLEFFAAFRSKRKALEFEKYLKSSSGFVFRNKRLIAANKPIYTSSIAANKPIYTKTSIAERSSDIPEGIGFLS